MKELLISMLNACFLHCLCMSPSIMTDKLNQVTHNEIDTLVAYEEGNKMLFKLNQSVLVTFYLDDTRTIEKITCEEVK